MANGLLLVVSVETKCLFQSSSRLARKFEVCFPPLTARQSTDKDTTGQAFTIEKVKLEDLEKGVLTASWVLEASHPSVSQDQIEKMMKAVLIGTLLSSAKGAWDVSDEFNQLLPDFKFTGLEDFLTAAWEGKP